MNINKELLEKFTLLYVEDDDVIRTELSSILSNFFKKVFVASDGKEGLRTYLENKDSIDIILTDINMPLLNGLDMVKKIRSIKDNVPVIFATAYSDSEFLIDAIKVRAEDYVVKPIDIKKLISYIEEIVNRLHNEFLLNQQRVELLKFKEILDSNNILLKANKDFKINYINTLFLEITNFKEEELLTKDLQAIIFDDEKLFIEIEKTLKENKSWSGRFRTNKKNGSFFHVEANIISDFDEKGNFLGVIAVLKDITKELEQKRQMQLALIKDKSEMLKKNKEQMIEKELIIKDLEVEISLFRKRAKNKQEDDKTNSYQKLILELSKTNKELQEEIEALERDLVNLEKNSNNKIEDEVLKQKLEYWKERAKNETSKLEELERQVIANVDTNLIQKIFN